MQTSMIQYRGFEQNLSARTCFFRVFRALDANQQERQFRLSVKILSLRENKFKLQDLPDLCFSRLKRELSNETGKLGLPLQMSISDGELRKYNDDHYPQRGKSHRPRKREQ